jgi:hypothetical protein
MSVNKCDQEVEEIEVAQNTLTDKWLSNPPRDQKKKKTQNRRPNESSNTTNLPTSITSALKEIKRSSGVSPTRSILRKTIVTFTKKMDQMPSLTTNHVTFLVPNAIKERQIFATEILSLDSKSSSTLSRWILDDRKIKIDNDPLHLELLKKLNESKNQHVIHNPSTKHTQDNVAYLSIISVLNLIGGGLFCISEKGEDDFFIVPTGPSTAKIVQICSGTLAPKHEKSICPTSEHKHQYSEEKREEDDDTSIREPDHKKQKVVTSDGNTSKTEDLRLDKRVLFNEYSSDCFDWNHLKQRYDECVTSDTISPLTFVKEMMTNVIQTEWSNKMESTNHTQNSSHKKTSCIKSILHQLRKECKILLTRTEITSSISECVELKQKERLIIMQALLRIQLFGLHLEDEDLTSKFLKEYAKHMGMSNVSALLIKIVFFANS